ncbi:MAG: MCE family protein [Fibrobacteria bacterium]|nr:MCE family protein [Fibrobacteria bacterium]
MNPTSSQLRWTGIFLVGGLVLAILSVVFLMGSRLARKTLPLVCAVRGESVSGVSTGGKVLLRGIEVGSIVSLTFDPADPERILIGIEIEPDAPVYQDATATLEIFGITGLKYLELVPGTPDSGKAAAGAVLAIRPSLTTGLLNTLDTVARSSARVLENLDHLTRRETQGKIDSILADLARSSRSFAEMAEGLREARLDSQATKVAHEVQGMIRRIDSSLSAGRPDKAILRVDSAAAALASVARRADVMLGRSQGDVYRTLEDLRSTMRNLTDFSQTIRDNPAALLRSGDKGERE